MKKQYLLALISLLLIQCNSIKNQNAHLDDLISENDLKTDVDFAYKKIQKLHPRLFWYISKEKLDYKFDSLKSTITKPLTTFDFYKKLNASVYAIKQGHMFIYPSVKQYTKKETKALAKKGIGPLSQFDFEVFDGKLYVAKNKSYNKTIKSGTEVVAINGKKTTDLLNEYQNWFTSDGNNKTFKKNFLGKRFSNFYTFENGLKDSIIYDFKYNDTLKSIAIKRKVIDTAGTNKNSIKKQITTAEKEKARALKKKKDVFGYNETTQLYNRNLKFIEKDSTIAVMKINGFNLGDSDTFYKESFTKIQAHKSKFLVIDLRDNGGGRLKEISNLYAYLADSTFVFLDKSEVVSKTSLMHIDYFKGSSIGVKAIKGIFSPIVYGFLYFSVHKDSDGKYYYNTETRPHKLNENAFKGKVYVLINGGSFSASSILSSNLKGSKRATFVGEETGGAFNGCVAGQMPLVELPKSKIKIRLGLMTCVPHYKSSIDGRGIFPDQEIIPTLKDRINNNDPEMNWILKDIHTEQSVDELLNQNKK